MEPRASAGASPHLLAGLDGDVLSEDLLGLGDHLGLGFDLLELLTGQPELQVLLTELSAQEGPEGSESVCGDRDTSLLPATGGEWPCETLSPATLQRCNLNYIPLKPFVKPCEKQAVMALPGQAWQRKPSMC